MTLTDLFDLSLIGRPEQIALEFEGREFTFGELEVRSNRVAHYLLHRGFAPGDRLCVYLANCVEMIDLYLACVKLGVIFVPINILYRDREITHILTDAEPREFINDVSTLTLDASAFVSTRPTARLNGDSPAGIIYTSGTTGVAKGAVLSHNNFASNAVNLLACWRITTEDRLLLALPLFHVHGLGNGLHCWLMSGCRLRLLERFEHQKAAAIFLEYRPTIFFGVPTIYVRLLEMDPEIAKSMRLFVSGSAPLPAQVMEEFCQKFGHTILERYGMSETLMNLSNPYEGERRPGTVGFPLPGISARIVDGEIQLRGPNVFLGYWKREEATQAAFVDGWFKTGDIATVSEDGYYTLCGRRSDLIISGGFNIYPREIEEFLTEHPAVVEAAVVARQDRVRGEVPVAYVVRTGGAGVELGAELEELCRKSLASFKVPREFIFIEKLPRNAMGKVQKHLLGA
jgi:malonyl-CoA/methylmalonyl-CoA synthetase